MIDKTNNSIFRSNKFQNILHNANKRRISRPVNPTSQQDYIYDKYFNKFLLHGINPYTDQCLDLMDRTTLNQISDQLCYDITQDSSNDYIEGTRINLEFKLHKLRDIIAYICWDYENKNTPPKLNLSYIRQDSFKGLHRAGWQYCIEPLYCLSSDYGIFLDTYIDKTFGWSSNILQKVGILPYTNYWIGFVHHTFNTSFSDNNCTHVFSSQLFLDSLPLCKGLFCLTEYLSQQVREKLYQLGFNIKVNTLMHPTVFPPLNFSMNKYLNNKDKLLINVGSWYRNPVSIHLIPPITNIKFATLRGKKMESNFPPTDMIVMMEEDNLICYNNIWSEFFMEYLNEHKDNYSLILYNKIRNYLKENSQINIRDFEGEDYLQPFIDKVQVIQT
jgi:hypothetical protein